MKEGDWITVFPTSKQATPKNHLATSITMLEQSKIVYIAITRCGRVFYYPSELTTNGRGKRIHPDCKVCTMASEADARKAS